MRYSRHAAHLPGTLAIILLCMLTGCSSAVRPIRGVLWIGGFAHEWEPAAEVIRADLQRRLPIGLEVARDASFLDSADAAELDVIVMHHCHEKVDGVIDAAQQQKLLKLVSDGVGVVGLHASYYSFVTWVAYHEMFGARWIRHGDVGVVLSVRGVDPEHDIMRAVPPAFEVVSELYESTPLAPGCRVLTMAREKRGSPECPSAWTHMYGNGRVVAILPGHGPDAFAVPAFAKLIAASTQWAAHRRVQLRNVSTEPAS